MVDKVPTGAGEDSSPEQVAYRLMLLIATAEKKHFNPIFKMDSGFTQVDRKWLLDTYAECIDAVTRRRTG